MTLIISSSLSLTALCYPQWSEPLRDMVAPYCTNSSIWLEPGVMRYTGDEWKTSDNGISSSILNPVYIIMLYTNHEWLQYSLINWLIGSKLRVGSKKCWVEKRLGQKNVRSKKCLVTNKFQFQKKLCVQSIISDFPHLLDIFKQPTDALQSLRI